MDLWAATTRPDRPTRRAVLAAGLLLPLAACTGTSAPPAPLPLDPDVALRAAALARERGLLALYDRALADPALLADGALAARLAALRADHAVHLTALELPVTPDASPTPTRTPTTAPAEPVTVDDLAAAERVAAANGLRALVGASRELAVVLASVCACEATHAEVLA